jgi:chemotaxis protein CheX
VSAADCSPTTERLHRSTKENLSVLTFRQAPLPTAPATSQIAPRLPRTTRRSAFSRVAPTAGNAGARADGRRRRQGRLKAQMRPRRLRRLPRFDLVLAVLAQSGGAKQCLAGDVMAGNSIRRKKPLSFWTEIDVKEPKRMRSRKRSQKLAEVIDPQTDQAPVEAPPLPQAEPSAGRIDALSPPAASHEPPEAQAPDDPVPLPAALNLAAASELARTLLARRGQNVVVDAAAVLHLSAPCAQVLMSAAATWTADEAAFSIENCGAKMIEDLRILGIAPSSMKIEAAAP